jgi:hypothetical protein
MNDRLPDASEVEAAVDGYSSDEQVYHMLKQIAAYKGWGFPGEISGFGSLSFESPGVFHWFPCYRILKMVSDFVPSDTWVILIRDIATIMAGAHVWGESFTQWDGTVYKTSCEIKLLKVFQWFNSEESQSLHPLEAVAAVCTKLIELEYFRQHPALCTVLFCQFALKARSYPMFLFNKTQLETLEKELSRGATKEELADLFLSLLGDSGRTWSSIPSDSQLGDELEDKIIPETAAKPQIRDLHREAKEQSDAIHSVVKQKIQSLQSSHPDYFCDLAFEVKKAGLMQTFISFLNQRYNMELDPAAISWICEIKCVVQSRPGTLLKAYLPRNTFQCVVICSASGIEQIWLMTIEYCAQTGNTILNDTVSRREILAHSFMDYSAGDSLEEGQQKVYQDYLQHFLQELEAETDNRRRKAGK